MEEKEVKVQENANTVENSEYREERFEFALFVNNNLVCKRNFKMRNFIEGSMQSENFKHVADDIVQMIDDDLKSKSRVYTWFYYNPNDPDEEFTSPLIEPWECTFKFVIFDNKRPVYERIWDGRFYPAMIRNNVDIANNVIKITTKTGEIFTYDKDKYFSDHEDRLSPEMYVKKAMIGDKPNLLPIITKRICEACSPWNDSGYSRLSDYDTVLTFGKGKEKRVYGLNLEKENARRISMWGKAVENKTKTYFNRK